MPDKLKFLLELSVTTLVILFLSLFFSHTFFNGQKSPEIVTGYLISLIIFIFGFLTMNWSFKKSLKTFLTTILGGMLVRFILLGLAIFLLMRFTKINIVYFLASFFVFYLIYQLFEIRFINSMISKGKK